MSGHTDSPEEERELIDRARELTGNFPEANSASFSGMHTGSTNLLAPAEEGADAGHEQSALPSEEHTAPNGDESADSSADESEA